MADYSQLLSLLSQPGAFGAVPRQQGKSTRDEFMAYLDSLGQARQQPIDVSGLQMTKPAGKSPSVLSRVLDVISRPLYTVAEPIKRMIEPGGDPWYEDIPKGAFSGFTGKGKATARDISIAMIMRDEGVSREEAANKYFQRMPGQTRFLTEFGGNVAMDPLSYVNPVGIYNKVKGVKPGPVVNEGKTVSQAIDERAAAGATANELENMSMLRRPKWSNPDSFGTKPRGYAQPIEEAAPATFQRGPVAPEIPDMSSMINQAVQRPVPFGQDFPGMAPRVPTPEPVAWQQGQQQQNYLRSEAFQNMQAAGKNPKVARADEINEGYRAAQEAGYKNLESAQRAGRAQAAKETPVSTPFGADRTANYTPVPKSASEVVAAIARGSVEDLAKAVPKTSNVKPWTTAQVAKNVDVLEDTLNRIHKAQYKGATKTKPLRLDRNQQVGMFRSFVDRSVRRGKGRKPTEKDYKFAYNMMKLLEQNQSVKLVGAGNENATSLTNIIDELGGVGPLITGKNSELSNIARAFDTGDFANLERLGVEPKLIAAIQGARARHLLGEIPKLDELVNTATQQQRIADEILSPGAADELAKREIPELLKTAVNSSAQKLIPRAQGATKTTRQTAADILRQQNKTRKSPVQSSMDAKASWFEKANTANHEGWLNRKAKVDILEVQRKGIEKELLTNYKNLAVEIGAANRAIDTFMARYSTHWGQRNIRPFYNTQMSQAMQQMGNKAEYLNQLSRDYTPEELLEAFRSVQGYGAATGNASEAAVKIEQLMGIMFDSKGANSVLTRGLVNRKELNAILRQLDAATTFTNSKKVEDMLGVTHDLSKGTDWMNSWKFANVENPIEELYKLDTALERVSHKNIFLDEAGARWGSAERAGAYQYKVDIPRLAGYYFPKDIAQELANFSKSINNELFTPKGPMMRQLDRVLSTWKLFVTIPIPSHHIRNLIGDVNLNWWAGVNSPVPYTKAITAMNAYRKNYRDLAAIEQLAIDSPDMLKAATSRPQDTLLQTKGGLSLTNEQVVLAAAKGGILQKATTLEDIAGTPFFTKNAFMRGAQKFSESRDHFARLAHFIDIVQKSKGKDLAKIFEDAAQQVRKWHPDGTDLTNFERSTMRRIIPFYSWIRKSTPLIFEALAKNPGKIVAYPKAMAALQSAMGIDTGPGYADPFPSDQLFPDWLEAKGIGPILSNPASFGPMQIGAGAPGGFGQDAGGYVVANPSNPFLDFFGTFGTDPDNPVKGAAKGLLTSITPFVKIPYETTTGKQILTGAPIQDPGRYVTENLPLASVLSRMTGSTVSGGETLRAERGDTGARTEAFINFLTALGLTGTGPSEAGLKVREKFDG